MPDRPAIKDDSGKARFDLIPPRPLMHLAELYAMGARKYEEDRNWEKGLDYSRVFAAMMRHAWAFWNGEEIDPVDGQHHLDSVAWCAFALREYRYTHPEKDDRPYKPREHHFDVDKVPDFGPIYDK